MRSSIIDIYSLFGICILYGTGFDHIPVNKNIMASLTAILKVLQTDLKGSEMEVIRQIDLTENSRPAFILRDGEFTGDEILVIPTLKNMMDDLLLMVAVYVLGTVKPYRELSDSKRTSLYDNYNDRERQDLYKKSSDAFRDADIKLFLHVFPESHLVNQLSILGSYPIDFEVKLSRD